MNKPTDDRPLVEKLRQLAKWCNLSNPYVHRTLLEAADEIESLQKELFDVEQDIRSVFGPK